MSKVVAPVNVQNLPPAWKDKDVLAQPLQLIHKKCLMPNIVTKGQDSVPIEVTNPTENFVTLKSGMILGNMIEVEKVYNENNPDEDVPYIDDDISICVLKTTQAKAPVPVDEDEDNFCPNIHTSDNAPLPQNVPFSKRLLQSKELRQVYEIMPKHIQDLFERSCVNLYDDQAVALDETWTEFADVFAKDDFDIGCFSGGIEHDIDTGDANPVKDVPCTNGFSR